jgi:hypothetical protein
MPLLWELGFTKPAVAVGVPADILSRSSGRRKRSSFHKIVFRKYTQYSDLHTKHFQQITMTSWQISRYRPLAYQGVPAYRPSHCNERRKSRIFHKSSLQQPQYKDSKPNIFSRFGYYSWTDPRMRNPRNYRIPQGKILGGAHAQKHSPESMSHKHGWARHSSYSCYLC